MCKSENVNISMTNTIITNSKFAAFVLVFPRINRFVLLITNTTTHVENSTPRTLKVCKNTIFGDILHNQLVEDKYTDLSH